MKQRSSGFWSFIFVVSVAMLAVSGPVFAGPGEAVQAEQTQASMNDSQASESEIVLYYFHGTRRCRTCLSIEAFAVEAIEEAFPGQLESGDLQWRVVNFEEKDSRHFVEEFGLVSSSLVVVEASGDEVARFQVLQDAWTLVRKKPEFIDYVQNSVRGYLE